MGIRKALRNDIREIAKIYHIEAAKKPYFQKRTCKESLNKIISHFKKADIYVVTNNNEILGFIVVRLRYNGKDLYVDEIWLKSRYQGKGLGKSLMSFIENKYKKSGIKSVTLIAGKKPGAAFGFYKKLKFKEINELDLMKKNVR